MVSRLKAKSFSSFVRGIARSFVEEFSFSGQLPESTTLGELHQNITTIAAVANCPRRIPLMFLYQPN